MEIPNYFHSLIAQKVIKGYAQSIEKVLPGYKKMKKSLQEICDTHLENNKENDSNLTWVVKDGCRISNVYFADPKIDSIGAWGGMDSATKAMRNVARNKLSENSQDLIPMENLAPVEFEKLIDVLDQETYDKLRQHEETRVSEIADALSESNTDSDSINFDE